MTRTAKQYAALFLVAAVVGLLAWRLWPDGGRAQRRQHDNELLIAVLQDRLADTTRLLDEGADPSAQTQPRSITEKAQKYYFLVSHGMGAPNWGAMDNYNPRLSALQIAVDRGDADVVSLLLMRGADVGHRDRAGDTALDLAEIRRALLQSTSQSTGSYPRIIALLKAAETRQAARR